MAHDQPTNDKQQTVTALTVTNVLLGILALGFLGAFVYAEFIYQPELDPDVAAKYTAVAKERLAKHSDVMFVEAAEVASEAAPPIGEAFYEQAKDDYKLYLTTLDRESDVYLTNVEKVLVAKAQAQFREYLREHRDVLKEEFPEHASDENVEKVLAEFEGTFNRMIERYYLDEFRREADRTVALWGQFEPLDLPSPDEPTLEEQLADYTADWVILAASEGSSERIEQATP